MPRIQTTLTVRIALWGLRIYLIILLTLILFKFLREFQARRHQKEEQGMVLLIQHPDWTNGQIASQAVASN